MRYLLDTNICIHILRGNFGIARIVEEIGDKNCFISEITKAELLVGAVISENSGHLRNAQAVRGFLNVIESVPVSGTLDLYAREKVRLRIAGQPIEDFDLLIACTAVSLGMVMVTENVSHFSRVSGIRLENWAQRTGE